MAKQLASSKQIVLQGPPQEPTEQQRKADLIEDYVEKFATIAGRALTPALYALYVEALSDIPERRLKKGLRAYLRGGTKWPWPGEIRDFCEEDI